ncbi:MAG: hypothetical protein A2Z14_05560 [Chloroflexi bacterium RBG_16_48_8]|nr:MAG: hypothetical protein A2Z14_05560 [Chloroflexi bacterium RBG_16_48_8]
MYIKFRRGVLGLAIIMLSFLKLPESLATYLAQRRGQRYIKIFSILLPLLLVLASATSTVFPLIIILRGYKAPLDILVALALEILIVLINLIVLILNVTAPSVR